MENLIVNKKKIKTGKIADIVAIMVSFMYIIASSFFIILIANKPNSTYTSWTFQCGCVLACSIFLIVFICVGFFIAAKSEHSVNNNITVSILKLVFALLLFIFNLLLSINLFLYYSSGLGLIPVIILIPCIIMLVYIILNIILFSIKDYIMQKK